MSDLRPQSMNEVASALVSASAAVASACSLDVARGHFRWQSFRPIFGDNSWMSFRGENLIRVCQRGKICSALPRNHQRTSTRGRDRCDCRPLYSYSYTPFIYKFQNKMEALRPRRCVPLFVSRPSSAHARTRGPVRMREL